MPLKRITPSFTVEYRQAKRPIAGSTKPGWAHAKPAPEGLDEKANRIAISAFKTVAAKPPADLISPPIPTGRVLPSLVETAPVTGQPAPEAPNQGGSGAPRKQAMPCKYQETGQWLVTLASTLILPKT